MADNYLEHRMDDYRAGKLSVPRRRIAAQSVKSAKVETLRGTRVFILCSSASSSPHAEAMIRLLTTAGCRVAFSDSDSRTGNLLAQSTGAQCHPIDIADPDAVAASKALIMRRWGGIDIIVEM